MTTGNEPFDRLRRTLSTTTSPWEKERATDASRRLYYLAETLEKEIPISNVIRAYENLTVLAPLAGLYTRSYQSFAYGQAIGQCADPAKYRRLLSPDYHLSLETALSIQAGEKISLTGEWARSLWKEMRVFNQTLIKHQATLGKKPIQLKHGLATSRAIIVSVSSFENSTDATAAALKGFRDYEEAQTDDESLPDIGTIAIYGGVGEGKRLPARKLITIPTSVLFSLEELEPTDYGLGQDPNPPITVGL